MRRTPLFLGGFQVFFSLNRCSSGLYSSSSLASGSKKNYRNLILCPKPSRSCFISNLFIVGGWGANFNPFDRIFSSSWDSSTPDRLTTVWGKGLVTFVGGARWACEVWARQIAYHGRTYKFCSTIIYTRRHCGTHSNCVMPHIAFVKYNH